MRGLDSRVVNIVILLKNAHCFLFCQLGHYPFDKNKNWSEKDEEMKLHEQEERLNNGS